MFEDILQTVNHRNTPVPKGPWVMAQSWEHLLFMHLRVQPEALRDLIPASLQIDTFKGTAWITIIPFLIRDMRFGSHPVPYLGDYLELKVRSYVKRQGVPGLYFFSFDANKILDAAGARMTSLPYYYAKMNMSFEDQAFQYYSKRRGRSGALFEGQWRPKGKMYQPEKGSLESWLLERYYAWSPLGRLLIQVGIPHKPWQVREAEAAVQTHNLLPLPYRSLCKEVPLFHYAEQNRALFWPVKPVGKAY
ncbi:DUF2071 domain-containing protein [Metabacillus sp. GX 13764]|uniref:YqjF family protein n=1 Tax=Metabacillus kandeliae TaxID=2900151 RepID=UPI001E39883A|nr:DUF2071 domain-containing protein [Metabacillus kandeliae]MCD7036451.1 DUF2071 domain-containing protein [Metabacillus kandeliae]